SLERRHSQPKSVNCLAFPARPNLSGAIQNRSPSCDLENRRRWHRRDYVPHNVHGANRERRTEALSDRANALALGDASSEGADRLRGKAMVRIAALLRLTQNSFVQAARFLRLID